jgi:hypothetical protein
MLFGEIVGDKVVTGDVIVGEVFGADKIGTAVGDIGVDEDMIGEVSGGEVFGSDKGETVGGVVVAGEEMGKGKLGAVVANMGF